MADLLTATLAVAHQRTAVHYDADFETAATVLTFQHHMTWAWVGRWAASASTARSACSS